MRLASVFLTNLESSSEGSHFVPERYVLHRLFVHRHAMQIKGLQADGMDWKNVTTSKVLEELGASPVSDLI